MQPILKKVLQNTLSNEQKLKALFMRDDEPNYYLYAWIENDEVIKLGYGKDTDYCEHKPNENTLEGLLHPVCLFPYEGLTEKEAYVLYIYESNKFQRLGYKNMDDFGLWTEEI